MLLSSFVKADELKKVTLQLSWFDQFQFAGYYVAKEKGFYKDVGLDVNIKPFKFGVDTANGIHNGDYEFAIGRETLLLEKAKGKDIAALYAIFQSSPLVLLSTKESGIDSIEKFKDKKIMTTIDDASEVSLKAMIFSKKFNLKELNFINHTHNINDLIDKKTDVISAYISKSPFELNQKGVEYNVFAPRDYGFDMYSDFLITSNKLIENDLLTVLSFKEASLKGWEYAYSNIEESVDIILNKYNRQNLSKKELIYEAKELKKLSYYKTKILGDINLAKLQRIHDLYNIMGLLPNKIDINSFFFQKRSFYSNLSVDEKNFIKSNEVISIGEFKQIKPLNYLDEIGIHNGILHDYLEIISTKTGLRFIPHLDKKENLLTALSNKTIHIFDNSSYVDSDDTMKSHPYFNLHEMPFKLKNSSIKTVSNIGILNFIYSKERNEILKNYSSKINLLSFNSLDEAVIALEKENIDILYVPEELFLNFMKDRRKNNIDYAPIEIEINKIPISFVLNSDSTILTDILNKAIKDISIEQHEAIRNKWIPLVFKSEFDWESLWEVILVLFIIFIMIIYKQISMKNLIHELKTNQNELKKANERLKELSELDHLTKLYNRRYFENICDDILNLERRTKSPTSLLMFDIDDFKKINDTYGHKAGDEVLRKLGILLKKVGRKSDIISRIGGEEFAILLPNTSLDGAKSYAHEIRKAIEELIVEVDGLRLHITVSMGLTQFKNNENLSKVLVRADENQYIAKKQGKNRVYVS